MASCPLCSEAFTTVRLPHIRLCHTFCMTCLEVLHKNNTGIIPCPQCTSKECYDSVHSVPIDLVLMKEGEEERSSLQQHQPPHFLKEVWPPKIAPNSENTQLITWPKISLPHKLRFRPIYLKLPNPISFPYTTRIEYRADGRNWLPYFNVTYYKSNGNRLFRTSGEVCCDQMECWASNPKFKNVRGNKVKITPCGIVEKMVQVLAIIEDQMTYDVFLDGIMQVSLKKVEPDEKVSLCKKIVLEGACIMIQSFTVSEGRTPF